MTATVSAIAAMSNQRVLLIQQPRYEATPRSYRQSRIAPRPSVRSGQVSSDPASATAGRERQDRALPPPRLPSGPRSTGASPILGQVSRTTSDQPRAPVDRRP